MKKKIFAVALAAAMSATLFAGCGSNDSAETSEPSSAAETSQDSAAETSEESTAETSEGSTAETSEGSAEDLAGDATDDPDAGVVTDTWLRANYQDLLGDESAEGKTIGFTLISQANDFMLSLANGIVEAFAAEGVEVQVDSCDGDPTKQAEQVENFITMGKDLIIIFPVTGDALVTVANQAEEAGIPVIAFAMDIPSDKLTCHIISADEAKLGYASGKQAAEWANENLADKDEINVLIAGSTSSPELKTRTESQVQGFEENCTVNYKITRQDTQDSNSTEEGRNLAENMWTSGQWDLVIAVNQQTAIGFNSYMTSTDAPLDDVSKFAIFCVDETEEVIQNIQASKNNESTLRGTVSMGAVSDTVDVVHSAAMPILTGGTPMEHVNGDAIVIGADDV
jgi:ABC-type sugar transport system substrate-binding protein